MSLFGIIFDLHLYVGECFLVVPFVCRSDRLVITNGREANVHFKRAALMTTATPSFGEQKVENKCRQDEQTVFSPTVSCSSSRYAPQGGDADLCAGWPAGGAIEPRSGRTAERSLREKI